MTQREGAAVREDLFLPETETESDEAQALIETIARDARRAPDAYLRQTVSPGGGE